MAHFIWLIKNYRPKLNRPMKTQPGRNSNVQATEEMVAFLAFIGFYIFGICIYEICIGLFEPSIEKRIRKESRENNQMHYLII